MGVISDLSVNLISLEVTLAIILVLSCRVCSDMSFSQEHIQAAQNSKAHQAESHLRHHLGRLANTSKAPDLLDTVFDFNFSWDEEPPEFINHLDLEVKWEDDEDSKPSKVSLKNVTMDHDITGPMTKLITSMANSSSHQSEMPVSSEKRDELYTSHSTGNSTACSCEQIESLKQRVEVLKEEVERRGKRGRRGFKGEKGDPGISIVGPKGEPGDPGLLPYHLLHPNTERLKGEPGPRGPPGTCPSACSGSNPKQTPANTKNIEPTDNPGSGSQSNFRIVPGALVFKTLPSMFQMSTYVLVGSVVFVEETGEFYGRSKVGWRKFQMGSLEVQ